MEKIGIVVAVEDDALKQRYGIGEPAGDRFGTTYYNQNGSGIYVVRSGAGEILAAMATQHLIDRYGAQMILNYGVVGGCREDVNIGDLYIVERVIHYDYDLSGVDDVPVGYYSEIRGKSIPVCSDNSSCLSRVAEGLRPATCASGDKFINSAEKKKWLQREFGADICDMESAGIALTCLRNEVPCIIIKAVSDTVTGGGEEYWQKKAEVAERLTVLMERIIRILSGAGDSDQSI